MNNKNETTIEYYTLVLHKTVPAFTDEWNSCPSIWSDMTRGNFKTEQEACEYARKILPHGAPFSVKFISKYFPE